MKFEKSRLNYVELNVNQATFCMFVLCVCILVSGTCQDRVLRDGHVFGTLRFLLGCGFRMHRIQLPLGVGQCVCVGSGHRHLGPSRGNGRGTWQRIGMGTAVHFARLRSPSGGPPRPVRRLPGNRRRPRLCTGGAGGFAPGAGGMIFLPKCGGDKICYTRNIK